MTFAATLASAPLILAGGSMYERMRRSTSVPKDPDIAHAALMYDDDTRRVLERTHREYIDVALDTGLPMLVMAGTWRANRERIARSRFAERPVNEEYIGLVRGLCARATSDRGGTLFVGGVLGPRGDAYRPDEALSEEEAVAFHAFQAERLAGAEPDLLLAMTLPAISEARGLARVLAETGRPYLISFIIRGTGALLDGTPLAEAIDQIDTDIASPPLGYFLNCIHPSVVARALDASPSRVAERIVGLKANTSTLRPEELDESKELITEAPDVLAAGMRDVQNRFGLSILGGCCGTGTEHVEKIAERCGGTANG